VRLFFFKYDIYYFHDLLINIFFFFLFLLLIEELLIGLKDKDTVVRWSAAKGSEFHHIFLIWMNEWMTLFSNIYIYIYIYICWHTKVKIHEQKYIYKYNKYRGRRCRKESTRDCPAPLDVIKSYICLYFHNYNFSWSHSITECKM